MKSDAQGLAVALYEEEMSLAEFEMKVSSEAT